MPTVKQTLVAKKILENPSKPLGAVMREVGYSENSAVAPSKNLLESKGWQQLLEEHLPDLKLTEVHAAALDAVKVHSSMTEPDRVVPDWQIRLKATELGYKVKGKLNNDAIPQGQQTMNIGTLININEQDQST